MRHRGAKRRLTQCIPQNLRDKTDGAGYAGHGFLLKMACSLDLRAMYCLKKQLQTIHETRQAYVWVNYSLQRGEIWALTGQILAVETLGSCRVEDRFGA